ncbi:MAG: type I DNA topoisomerase [Alphaproteobacteria bacterium]|nr:MAG: type I DNA topoisomerase [Alphaproteobacteria bacterium]
MKLIVVESPTKAKALSSYLKDENTSYKVLASYGHIRALSKKSGSVDPEHDFDMHWEIPTKADKALKSILSQAKLSDEIILATDPDREGEAIAWHLCQLLKKSEINKKISRMSFHSITPNAIKESLKNLDKINEKLVDAYMARLGLDYLVGFSISPILWRKVPGSKSAGRVQSAALRIITDRESEIEAFIPQNYWTFHAIFTQKKHQCSADLIEFEKEKIDKFTIQADQLESIMQKLKQEVYHVSDIEIKDQIKRSSPPLITSTLQQEAANKLGWQPIFTMKVAQKLYEGIQIGNNITGLITYMRTDSVHIAKDKIEECRNLIKNTFGDDYLPATPNTFKSKVRNAQEAHEAIRPTNFKHTPNSIKEYLDNDCFKLYKLIWERAVSSQMSPAVYEICNLTIQGAKSVWKAHGVKNKFDGFQKLYNLEKSENTEVWNFIKDQVLQQDIKTEEHQTKAPSRFTETSLIKYLEEHGIGRPSTYANILYVLQSRQYVVKQNKSLVPSNLGWLVSAFLKSHFSLYVQDEFTSELENELDLVSNGEKEWKKLLKDFWNEFKLKIHESTNLNIKDVFKNISNTYMYHFFKSDKEVKCTKCSDGIQELRISKGNGFLCCSNYPNCKWNKSIESELDQNQVIVGQDPVTQDEILIKHGPYGYYLQWGSTDIKTRIMLPKMFEPPHNLTLEEAMELKNFPKVVGIANEDNSEIKVGIGKFGPWILYKNTYVSLKKNPFTVTLEECMEILNLPRNKKKIDDKNQKAKK